MSQDQTSSAAAVLRAPPDLGQIMAVRIMRFMLHSVISAFENAGDAAVSANGKAAGKNKFGNEALLVVENFRSGEPHHAIR